MISELIFSGYLYFRIEFMPMRSSVAKGCFVRITEISQAVNTVIPIDRRRGTPCI